jgi:hypothetical protein
VLSLALVAVGVLAVGLAGRGADSDRRAFAVAVVVSLAATPVLWMHYFVLLFVPIALYRKRLSAVWFAPLLLWLTPTTHSHGNVWRIALALGVMAAVAVVTTLGRPRRWHITPRAARIPPSVVRGIQSVASTK